MSSKGMQIVAGTLLLAAAAGCGGGGAWPLDRVQCERNLEAKGEDELRELLSGAVEGDCVQPARGEYSGSFLVPAGVVLAGNEKEPPVFLGGAAGEPALILEGGPGSLVAHLDVASDAGHGLLVLGGPARVMRSRLSAPKGVGLVLRCFESGCDTARVEILENEIHDSLNGIVIEGVNAFLEDNDLHDFDGVSIEAGIGLSVTGGATLQSDRMSVRGAGEVAVLVDGAETKSAFTDLIVSENRGRGVWAQFLRGTIDAPALTIDGATSEITGSAIVGLGGIDAQGIVVGTCRVRDTAPIELLTDQGYANVGDGVGLFGGSGEVSLRDGLEVSGNARAGLLVDEGGTSIVVGTAIVEPGTGGFGVVIQRTTNAVDLDASLNQDDPGAILGVAASPLNVPGV
ncbi:MAG: hypothetical protein P1V51_20525 [Deltaproteobacteria bacterium]|nr:hypothetical protein [Deltaproteobacteria bacterium]